MASGDTLLQFLPQSGEPTSANFATRDIRNYHPVLDFAQGESIVFSAIMPAHYAGGGVTVKLHYAMSSAESGNVELATAFERIGDQQQDIDSDGFATANNTADQAVPATSGLVDVLSIAHTDGAQLDSISAGEGFRLKVTRNTPDDSPAIGDLELRFVELVET